MISSKILRPFSYTNKLKREFISTIFIIIEVHCNTSLIYLFADWRDCKPYNQKPFLAESSLIYIIDILWLIATFNYLNIVYLSCNIVCNKYWSCFSNLVSLSKVKPWFKSSKPTFTLTRARLPLIFV